MSGRLRLSSLRARGVMTASYGGYQQDERHFRHNLCGIYLAFHSANSNYQRSWHG
jgi:hypothetical protein